MSLGGSLRERSAMRVSGFPRNPETYVRGVLEECYEVRALIKDQSDAAWYTMYESRSIIDTVSIPPNDFDDLLRVFSVHYTVCSRPGRRGRPPRVQQKHAVLAMLLHYYTAVVKKKTLQELFGVSSTTFSRVLRRAEVALDRALSHMQDAAVRCPSKTLQRDWAVLTNAKEPLVYGVFAFVDGKNYRVQSPSNAGLQNAHYNGMLTVTECAICIHRVAALSLCDGMSVFRCRWHFDLCSLQLPRLMVRWRGQPSPPSTCV
ncbi:hypothetical protein DYB37_013481 [Aphanomyces astaci]|uniref:DDE Tnp4 domain-containing protein n=1 Tax=Aphanomyces astaci TaxID=112090 RepID=A0A418EGF8_APHAT|nr:hypothetical protein DYB37_013481 [Aphanomyces astaci]